MFDDCLIMAGGSGTRLWPASSSKKPKQFLHVAKDRTETFFSLSLERAFHVIKEGTGKVIVIAGKTHIPFVIEACSALGAAEKKRLVLIPEPMAKNTAPAVACAVTYSRITGGHNRSMLVLTSDHIIGPMESFRKDAETAAFHAIAKDTPASGGGRLVVFGIVPSRPETGYGYIETSGRPADGVYNVTNFREKPDFDTAKKLAASKKHFWNSGMFAFGCNFIEEEYSRLAAPVIRPFARLEAPSAKSYSMTKGLRVLANWDGLEEAYRRTKAISFDYAIAVNCKNTVMVRSRFDWIDIGSWDEYARLTKTGGLFPADAAADVKAAAKGDVYTAGISDSCFVDSDIPVALVGVDDLIVVIRSGHDGLPRAALVAKKGESQRVKEIVEQIKKTGKTEIL